MRKSRSSETPGYRRAFLLFRLYPTWRFKALLQAGHGLIYADQAAGLRVWPTGYQLCLMVAVPLRARTPLVRQRNANGISKSSRLLPLLIYERLRLGLSLIMGRVCGKLTRHGGMAEWLKALVLKTSRAKALVGSNPTSSATDSLAPFFRTALFV